MRNRTLLPRVVRIDEAAGPQRTPSFSVSPLFRDGMVLQRERENTVWGSAPVGAAVTVQIDGQRHCTVAGRDGAWRVTIGAVPVGGPHSMTIRCGDQSHVVRNILCGDVWVCAGQSNMEWPLQYTLDSDAVISAANHRELRFFQVTQQACGTPLDALSDGDRWHVCRPDTARWSSGVGFFFARALTRELGVPIGLIDNSYGGTCAEAWTSVEAIRSRPELKAVLDRHAEELTEPACRQRLDEWQRDVAAWNRVPAHEQVQWPVMLTWWRKIRPPRGHPRCVDSPGGLFNGMVRPLIPFGIRGVIWYQGESNVGRAAEYRTLLPTLIRDWRRCWGQDAFPFLVVQLANCGQPVREPGESQVAQLREAQLLTATNTCGVGLAVAIDVGDPTTPHPPNKQPVGQRLALAALRLAHGKEVVCTGPIYDRMVQEGSRIRLHFSEADGEPMSRGGEPLRHFAVAGEDMRFVWAKARVERDAVVVSTPGVPRPAAVRYAWSDNPDGCNLTNRAGLPASPFRTDS